MTPPDIIVPGNHEFDFGEEVFRARMAEFEGPNAAGRQHAQRRRHRARWLLRTP
jgi:2',3'-cyclic-nucleotide 2'-phosphodiesterase (5'-nucleotidase family)